MEKSTLLQIVSMQNALMQEMIFVFPRLGATPAHPFFSPIPSLQLLKSLLIFEPWRKNLFKIAGVNALSDKSAVQLDGKTFLKFTNKMNKM